MRGRNTGRMVRSYHLLNGMNAGLCLLIPLLRERVNMCACTGSPLAYVPLSIMNRKRLFQLEARQADCSKQQAWWIAAARSSSHHERNESETSEDADSESPRTPDDEVAPAPTIAVANSSDLDMPPVRIQEEMAEAIAAPLEFTPPVKPVYCHPETKTSQSNPIQCVIIIE